MDQPGKVANFSRGQLKRKNNIFLSRFAPENLISRDGFDRPFSILRLNLVLTRGIPPNFHGGVHLFILTAIRHRVSPEFFGSCNCVPMAFAAESPPAQGQ